MIILFYGDFSFSLDPFKTLNQYISRNWQIEEGLPQISVMTIQQGKDGYIWFGTEEGLVRFNGYDFKVHNKYTDNVLLSQYIISLRIIDDKILIVLMGEVYCNSRMEKLKNFQFQILKTYPL